MGTRGRIESSNSLTDLSSRRLSPLGFLSSMVGVNLVKHFNSFDKLSELIDGGDMSACYSTHTWESEPLKVEVIQPDGSSKFEYVQDKEGQTVYTKVKAEASPQYYSERGEDTPPVLTKVSLSFSTMVKSTLYVWEEGFWTCYDLHQLDEDRTYEVVEIPQVQ